MENVRRKCGFAHGIDVGANCSKGGLCLGWSLQLLVSLRSYSAYHINVVFKEDSKDFEWRLMGFYGHIEERLKGRSWELLRHLGRDQILSWLVIGDFNEVAFSFEKKGDKLGSERNMFRFCYTLPDYDIMDLGFTRRWYTWEKGQVCDQ